MYQLSNFLDTIVERIGRVAMWSNGLLVFVIILQVVLRYIFRHGLVALEELEWHLYAVGIMTGISYAMVKDVHIRVDLISVKISKTSQDIVELLGLLFLFMPFAWVAFHHSLDFVHEAWRLGERSASPLGLPYTWFIKSLIPFGFGLMIISAISRIIRTSISLKERHHGAE